MKHVAQAATKTSGPVSQGQAMTEKGQNTSKGENPSVLVAKNQPSVQLTDSGRGPMEKLGAKDEDFLKKATARLIVNNFRQYGFIRASHGILRAAKVWHSEAFTLIEGKAFAALNGHGPLPEASSTAFEAHKTIISIVAERLRVFLLDGDLGSFFFNRQFGNVFQEVPPAYWAKLESRAMLERVFFEAFETQSTTSQPAPRDSFYFCVSDLTKILQSGSARKRSVIGKMPLPRAKQQKLADALRSIIEQNEGIRRKEQFKMLQELPEFRMYWITDRDLRAAAKEVPIKRGRPREDDSLVTAKIAAEMVA
jgi:hypothetical protein